MPIKTTFVIGFESILLINRNWSTISPESRLSIKPIFAVAQNLQSSAHPTWVDKHSVVLDPSFIRTDSMSGPLWVLNKNLFVNLESDFVDRTKINGWIVCCSFKRLRKLFGIFLKDSKSLILFLYIQLNICSAL